MSRFSVEMCSSHSTKFIRRGTILCFTNVLVVKVFWILGVSRFSVDHFLSHSTEFFHRRTLQCFTSFAFLKILSIIGVCHCFLWNCFRLTVPKIFVGESLCVSECSGIKKFLHMRGIMIFCGFFFCLTIAKIFAEEPFLYSLTSCIENC